MEYENYFRAFHFMVGALRDNEKAGRVTDVSQMLEMIESQYGFKFPVGAATEEQLKEAA
jgi:hypothetical protein